MNFKRIPYLSVLTEPVNLPHGFTIKRGYILLAIVVVLAVIIRIVSTDTFATFLGDFAVFSAWWFVPAYFFKALFEGGFQTTKTVHGRTMKGDWFSVDVPGRNISGDPDFAQFIFLLWLTAFPFAILYYDVWLEAHTRLLTVGVPLGGVVLIGALVHYVPDLSWLPCRIAVVIWKTIIGLAAINLFAHVLIFILRWIFK